MNETNNFKLILETELKRVENELKTVGRKNPKNPSDWEATPGELNTVDKADDNEVASSIEEFEDHTAILKQLEIRYNELEAALERLKKGTFGICSVCSAPIEKERLEANPAATTCKSHMEK